MPSLTSFPEIATLVSNINEQAKYISKDGSMDLNRRQDLQTMVQTLSLALETPGDTIQRLAYLPLQSSIVNVGINLGIFDKLTEAGNNGLGSGELTKMTGADPILLARVLRYLVAMGTMRQTSEGQFFATPISKTLAVPTLKAGVWHTHHSCGPPIMKLPLFLEETKYQNPTDHLNCAFQSAFGVKTGYFPWVTAPEQSRYLEKFNLWMIGQREGRASWLDIFPINEQLGSEFSGKTDSVMLVDVGGGLGHEVEALQTKYPDLPGRLILQDLAETLQQVDKTQVRFEVMAHDFFTPQPIRGARAYYFRQVFHDWADNKCREILKQTVLAMERGYSKILINEIVVPDIGAGMHACQVDFTMMAVLAAKERTETDWRNLLESEGLHISKIWTLDQGTESVIEAVKV